MDIDLGVATGQLERDGIAALAESYHNLLQAIASKPQQISASIGR